MQDYPLLLENSSRVGVVSVPRDWCFSAIKNDLVSAADKIKNLGIAGETAGECERDVYNLNATILRLCGAEIEEATEEKTLAGIPLKFGPKIIMHPSFGVTLAEVKQRL